MALEDVLTRCIANWRGAGIPLSPPVDETDVRTAWDNLGGRATEDVVRLYTTVGGFAEYEFDEEFLWCLWPWEMTRTGIIGRRGEGEGVMFCDHSIEVVTWELRFEDDRRSSVWSIRTLYNDSEMTAPSLESFLGLYLEDPWQLLSPWPP
jgi:hypothetical protein